MTTRQNERQQDRTGQEGKLKRFARSLGGFTLGYAGIGLGVAGVVASSPLSVPLGLATGASALYASKHLMRPLYEASSAVELQQERDPDSWLRKLGRGAIFTVGMGFNYIGANLLGSALWSQPSLHLNSLQRLGAGMAGLTSFIPGSLLVDQSYNPRLYDKIDAQHEQESTRANECAAA